MGILQWLVHPASPHSETGLTNSPSFDIADSVEVHALLKVTAVSGTSPSLTVTAQHSIDGQFWESLGGLAFSAATAAKAVTDSATSQAYRYLRFVYDFSGTSSPTVTFELHLFVKTRE